ncbi:hypothetical protein [Prevotella sp.]|uniref:hypothetical protein n=1 Tax=Prevotella sp. TaxID=59823 RepID=UPI0027E35AC9|nr:hypothetical protein [Prevotella sp.]
MAKLINKTKIIVPKEQISVLMNRFGYKKTAIYNALAYRSHSSVAQNIRKMALDSLGGRKVRLPMFEEE